jgi:hypothetical protein
MRAAALAALAATAGDLLLLHVANGPRPQLPGSAALPPALWLGGALGVAGIPVYALGYGAAARSLDPGEAWASRTVRVTGGLAALLGGVIHGLTTLRLAADVRAGLPAGEPLAVIFASGWLILSLWGIASLLATWASVVVARAVGRGRSRLPRGLAWTNPALLTVLLGLAGLPALVLRTFLTPAAPNLAHTLFFAACAVAPWRRLSDGGPLTPR